MFYSFEIHQLMCNYQLITVLFIYCSIKIHFFVQSSIGIEQEMAEYHLVVGTEHLDHFICSQTLPQYFYPLISLAHCRIKYSNFRYVHVEDYAIKFSIRLYREFNGIYMYMYEVSRWISWYCVWLEHIAMIFLHSNVCIFRHYFLTTDYQSRRNNRIYPSSIVQLSSQKSHKAYLIVYVHVYMYAVDAKGFADETNKITKQLIFQNHQQTVRDFTCSPLIRISFFFSSPWCYYTLFFSLFSFICFICSFLFRANIAWSVQYKWTNEYTRYQKRERESSGNRQSKW